MKNISEVKSFWNKVGDKYQDVWRLPATDAMSRKEMNLIARYIPTNCKTALDFGVGNGRILKVISENTNDGAVISGVDISEEMIKYSRALFSNNPKIISLEVVDDVTRGYLANRKFDLITSIRVLKYNNNWSEILQRLIDSLDEGGVLIFTLPNKNSINRLHKPSLTHMKATITEVKEIIRKSNVQVVDIQGFTRIPDKFYRVNSALFSRAVLSCEIFLGKLFGPTFLSRENFYVLKK